jgi:hypothetical protein
MQQAGRRDMEPGSKPSGVLLQIHTPVRHPRSMTDLREKPTDAWYRELQNGRVEIMCRAPGYRFRIAAPYGAAWEAVELFERWTGLAVESERRPPRRPKPMAGQLSMIDLGAGDGSY